MSIETRKPHNDQYSVDLVEAEIRQQILSLPAYSDSLRRNVKQTRIDSREIVFTGSGDSYAASLFGYYCSGGLAIAADPGELARFPRLCKDKTVYIISISGRTRANLILTKKISGIAKKRIAITSDPESPLARECDGTILLPYTRNRTLTPGTLSFTLSLLAVASRIERAHALRDLSKTEASAQRWASRLRRFPGRFIFVGSGIGYALCAYGAFKIHEILGKPADYDHTEQLGHSKIFSLKKDDNIVCFATKGDEPTAQLSKTLAKSGFASHFLTSRSSDPVVAGLEGAFSFQLLALTLARRAGQREVAFLSSKRILELSSRLIY